MKASLRRRCTSYRDNLKKKEVRALKLQTSNDIMPVKISLSPETLISSALRKRKRDDEALVDSVEASSAVVVTPDKRPNADPPELPLVACPIPQPASAVCSREESVQRSTPTSQSGSIAEEIFSPHFHAINDYSHHGAKLTGQAATKPEDEVDSDKVSQDEPQQAAEAGLRLMPCSRRGAGVATEERATGADDEAVCKQRGGTEERPTRLSGVGSSEAERGDVPDSFETTVSVEVVEESFYGDDTKAVSLQSADKEESGLVCIEETEQTGVDEDFEDFNPFLFIKRLPNLSDVVPACRPALLPKRTRRCPPITLVLDLDETLVHSTLEPCTNADFTFPVHFNNHIHTVHVKRRPHLEEFMEKVAQMFEIIVFTASQSIYAEQLLNILDPQRRLIRHRVFRDSCVYVEGNYLKDLTILGRDMAKIAIIDNSPQAFGFQVENGIPIESWFDDMTDTALKRLIPFLDTLATADDVRPLISKRFRLRERIESLDEFSPNLQKKPSSSL